MTKKNDHMEQQAVHAVSHGAVSLIQAEANKRGHGHRTAYSAGGAFIGAAIGSFFGLLPVLVLGAVATAIGYGIGEEKDQKAYR